MAIAALVLFNKLFSKRENINLFAEVKKGLFEITVANSGELIAEKSLDIYGPQLGLAPTDQQQTTQGGGQQGGGQQGGGQRTQGTGQQGGGQTGGGQTTGQATGQTGGQTGGQQGSTQGGQQRTGGQTTGGQTSGGGTARTTTTQGGGMDIRAMNFRILDIVPEGTIVKAGDYIAQIDRTNYENSLKDALQALTTAQTNVEMKILDTAMTMSSLRDEIKNINYQIEEARITLSQARFEPPATIRKAEMELNKIQRTLEQRIRSYELRKLQTMADIETRKIALGRQERLVSDLQEFLSQFRVTAPSDGMVIYKKDRLGTKTKAGSSLHPFDMVVATLPDLTTMLSKIYVNEIDVTKIEIGQKVSVNVDAFPEKSYIGSVLSIANIGETLPNSDSKMFEVMIRLEGTDMTLRPAMTTWNKIVIKSINDAIYIPLESVQAGLDSIPYVYKKNKTKQIVVLGEINDKSVVVQKGLTPGTLIYLSQPLESDQFRTVGKELIATSKQ